MNDNNTGPIFLHFINRSLEFCFNEEQALIGVLRSSHDGEACQDILCLRYLQVGVDEAVLPIPLG